MHARAFVLLSLATILLFGSCQKTPGFEPSVLPDPDPVPEPVDTISPPPIAVLDNKITANFIGTVLDEKGDPMYGAQVMAGGKQTLTDEYGVFRIQNAVVSQQSSFITARKTGYLSGSRTVISQATGSVFVQIKMLKKQLKGRFNSGDAGTISIDKLSSVEFAANSIVNSAGDLYQGNVSIYGAEYDATAPDFYDIMPGALRGLTADSQAIALRSYGMLKVLLESESGEPLNIAPGRTAKISMNVPQSILAHAPSQIPLWHFSEVDGKWREEGKASLQNGNYIGLVSHFSTWNFDDPYAFAVVKVRIAMIKGFAVPYQTLKITDESNNRYDVSKSDSLGYVYMAVPKNTPLKAEVLNDCGEVLGSEHYAPVTADKDLGVLRIEEEDAVFVQGKVNSCSGPFNGEGQVMLFANGLYYNTEIIDGLYQLPLNSCWQKLSKATIFAYDAAKINNSGTVELSINGSNTIAPDLTLCGNNMDEFLRFTFDTDEEVLITTPPDSSYVSYHNSSDTKIEFFQNSRMYGLGISPYFVLYDTVPHAADHNGFMMWYNGDEFVPKPTLHFDVTEYGVQGEFIHFTFSGELCRYPSLLETHTITGECRIRRKR